MWVILIAGLDTGFSIQGQDYYRTLVSAINFIHDTCEWVEDDAIIDIAQWETVGL